MQLPDDFADGIGSLDARLRHDALPVEQVPLEVLRADRLDLASQPVERVAVDAREQPPIARLFFLRARREAPAHHQTFRLERNECGGNFGSFKSERAS